MSEILKKLNESGLFGVVHRYYEQTGSLKLYVQGIEKYNNPDDAGTMSEEPRTDGTFDIEGHTWADIEGFFRINFFRLSDLKIYVDLIGQAISWFREFREINWEILRPLQSRWVWTVESLDCFLTEIADQRAYEAWQARRDRNEIRWVTDQADRALEKAKITPEETLKLLAEAGFVDLTGDRTMFVSSSDPTCIIASEKKYPYDMKTGRSDKMMTDIVAIWFEQVFKKYPSVVQMPHGW